MRYDLQIIASWIEPGSRVLDLGCGEGELLSFLKKEKRVKGTGIESSETKIDKCIENGVQVLQGDITEEVHDYPDNTFDYVILSQTLQQVLEPDKLIKDLLRVGKKIIVSFPNFSWYNTPNIRIITIKDFRRFVRETGCQVIKEAGINTHSDDLQGKIITFLPNLRATYGIFLVSRKNRPL